MTNNPPTVAQNTGSVLAAIQQVDQHIQALNTIHLQGGFDGSGPMQNALAAYQQSALAWPPVKGQITAALHYIVLSAGKVTWLNTLANTIEEPALLQESMQALKLVVDALNDNLQSARNSLDQFEQQMDQAYRDHANARNEANDALTQEQQNLDNKISDYNDDVDEANSVETGILTVVTAGIYGGYTLYELHQKLADLHSMEDRLEADRNAFAAASAAMAQANGAVTLTSQALDALNTGVEQAVNQLNDICTAASPNLHLMRTFIKLFVQEYTAAAQKLDGSFQPDAPDTNLNTLFSQGQDALGGFLAGLSG